MNSKTILITGSRKGIGRYLAEYYSQKECKVIGFSREDSDLRSDFYEHIKVDIGDDKLVKQAFNAIRKKYERLDVVINCAAISPSVSHFVLIPPEIVERIYRTNVFGLMNVSREAIKLMIRKKFGRIINISSMAAKHEVTGDSIYASSKAAVHSFTRVLAKEVNLSGITCNVLAPSVVQTDLSDSLDQKILKELLSRNAINEFGKMEDISNATDWLAQEQSSAITGQVIYLGGA